MFDGKVLGSFLAMELLGIVVSFVMYFTDFTNSGSPEWLLIYSLLSTTIGVVVGAICFALYEFCYDIEATGFVLLAALMLIGGIYVNYRVDDPSIWRIPFSDPAQTIWLMFAIGCAFATVTYIGSLIARE